MTDILAGILAAGVVARVIGALVILVVFWVIALIVSAIVRRVLRRLGLNRRMAGSAGGGQAGVNFEGLISSIVFWLIILFGLVAAFDVLQLPLITQPLTGVLAIVLAYLPRVFAAAILLLIAWAVAQVLRTVVTQALRAANVDERFDSGMRGRRTTGTSAEARAGATTAPPSAGQEAVSRTSLAESMGEVVYWLVFLFFLPAILGTLGLEGLLAPVQGLLDTILLFLPKLVAAALILVVGYFVARIVQRIVSQLLEAAGADRLTERSGLGTTAGGVRISEIVGMIVFVLIFLPVLTAALDSLGLGAVSQPISNMLNQLLAALPNIFAAAVILAVAFFLGRIVADLITGIVASLGFDRLPARLGLTPQATVGGTTFSRAVGSLVFAFILVTASMEAARLLGFGLLAELLSGLIVFGVRLIMGLILFALGLYLANLAYRAILGSGMQQAGLLSNVARVSILVLATAMALRETGLANEIVSLAFALLLGAVAVAAALAFGLGGREVARQQLEVWRDRAALNEIALPSTGSIPPPEPPTTPPAAPRL